MFGMLKRLLTITN